MYSADRTRRLRACRIRKGRDKPRVVKRGGESIGWKSLMILKATSSLYKIKSRKEDYSSVKGIVQVRIDRL